MSERVTFQILNSDGTFTDDITIWAHFLKDGFTRSETDNWFKMMVREQAALFPLLIKGNRIKWKNMTFTIFSWQDPSYEDRHFIEVMMKQIPTNDGITDGSTDGEFFKDIVSVYRMTKAQVTEYGLTTYKYQYDFTTPTLTGIYCNFSLDRNRYLDDGSLDVEHDSLIVKFNINAPIKKEDYIQSPFYGRFKVDMVVKNNENMLEAHVQRREVQ